MLSGGNPFERDVDSVPILLKCWCQEGKADIYFLIFVSNVIVGDDNIFSLAIQITIYIANNREKLW